MCKERFEKLHIAVATSMMAVASNITAASAKDSAEGSRDEKSWRIMKDSISA